MMIMLQRRDRLSLILGDLNATRKLDELIVKALSLKRCPPSDPASGHVSPSLSSPENRLSIPVTSTVGKRQGIAAIVGVHIRGVAVREQASAASERPDRPARYTAATLHLGDSGGTRYLSVTLLGGDGFVRWIGSVKRSTTPCHPRPDTPRAVRSISPIR
jgi:hypothetical protein